MDNIPKDYGAVANPNRFLSSAADQGKKGNGSVGGFGLAAVSRNKQGPFKSGSEAVSLPVPKNTNKLEVVKKRLLLISQLKQAENGKSRLPCVFKVGWRASSKMKFQQFRFELGLLEIKECHDDLLPFPSNAFPPNIARITRPTGPTSSGQK